MHLSYSVSKYKNRSYKSYSLAESYRDGPKVKKRLLCPLGKLTDFQAGQIRLLCQVLKDKNTALTRLDDVLVQHTKAYLDIAVVNEIWNQWKLDQAFDYELTQSPLSTPIIAKLLTINRCTDPCSHYSIPKWAEKNAVSEVLINQEGYPFKWDVYSGNTAEVKTLKRCEDDLYFHDEGVIGQKRFVVGFNPDLFRESRCRRQEKLEFFEKLGSKLPRFSDPQGKGFIPFVRLHGSKLPRLRSLRIQKYLRDKNQELKNAKRDRKEQVLYSQIIQELKRLKIRKYFEDPLLEPLSVKLVLKSGKVKKVKSFSVQIHKKAASIRADRLVDGVCVFVSNHTQKRGQGFAVGAKAIIRAYRQKTKIEDVFKNMKSFLKLRPFFVNTDTHVKAVYTVCMLAYFINKYLANQRKALGEKDFLNSKKLYAPFKNIDLAMLKDRVSGATIQKSVCLPEDTKSLLKKLSFSHLAFPQ